MSSDPMQRTQDTIDMGLIYMGAADRNDSRLSNGISRWNTQAVAVIYMPKKPRNYPSRGATPCITQALLARGRMKEVLLYSQAKQTCNGRLAISRFRTVFFCLFAFKNLSLLPHSLTPSLTPSLLTPHSSLLTHLFTYLQYSLAPSLATLKTTHTVFCPSFLP